MKIFMSVMIGYLLMFIFTFGHAYAHYPDTEQGYFGGEPYTIRNGTGVKGLSAIASSAFWPLYWSVKYHEHGITK